MNEYRFLTAKNINDLIIFDASNGDLKNLLIINGHDVQSAENWISNHTLEHKGWMGLNTPVVEIRIYQEYPGDR